MAIVRAVKTGVWSDPTVWNTGALPTADDDVYSNTFTVTIDTSPTVLSIRNGSTTGVTAGGSFVPTDGITLTCTGAGVVASILTCISSSLVSGQSFNINSNITGGTNNNTFGFNNTSSGACVISGNIFGYQIASGGLNQHGVVNSSSGTVNIIGNVIGGWALPSYGVVNSSSGTVYITGNVTGSNNRTDGYGAVNSGSGVMFVTGSVNGGGLSPGILNSGSGSLNIIGACAASVTSQGYAILNSSSGTVNQVGSLTSSGSAAAVGPGSLTQVTILSGPFLTVGSGINPVIALRWFWANSNVTPTYYQIRTANLATIRPLYTADSVGGNPATSNVRSGTIFGPNNELTGTCAVPPAAAVALGVPVDNTTGTAAITADSIRSALGLAVADLDTQLAALPTAAEVRSEMDANSTKLANLDATVSSRSTYAGADTSGTTTLLSRLTSGRAGNLDNLDATISSRPVLADIVAGVWSAATRTLTTAIDNSATIAAAVWAYASGSGRTITGGTVDTLTNAPSVPSADTIASRVWATADKAGYSLTEAERTAIATAVQAGILNESDGQQILNAIVNAIGNQNIDQVALVAAIRADLERTGGTLQTRLASSAYTTPPTASANAVAVWGATSRTVTGGTVDNLVNAPDVPTPEEIADQARIEFAAELSRAANTATTQEVADIVEGAMRSPNP